MKTPLFKLFSALSIIFGALLLFSSQIGLTGAVIGTEKAGSIGSIISLILVIGGMICGKSYEDIESELNRFNYKKLFL